MQKFLYGIFFFLLLMPLSAAYATGGTLYVTPQSGVYQIDQPFTVEVLADTGGQSVNAIEAEIAYNPSDFAVENISIDHSILTSWSTTPAYDGAAGIIRFSGWASGAYAGSAGLLITVTLRPLRVAQSTLVFNSGAMLNADDGSNIITTMQSGSFALSPKQVTPPAPAVEAATSSAPAAQTQSTPPTAPPQPVSAAPSDQAAALVSSGVTLAPFIAGFIVLLALIAFCIAYILHRKGIR